MKKENKLASETSKAPNRFVQHGKAINAIFARVVSGSKGQEQEIDLIPATDHPIGDKNEGEENGCIELARSSADFSIEYDDPSKKNEITIEGESADIDFQTDDKSAVEDDVQTDDKSAVEDDVQTYDKSAIEDNSIAGNITGYGNYFMSPMQAENEGTKRHTPLDIGNNLPIADKMNFKFHKFSDVRLSQKTTEKLKKKKPEFEQIFGASDKDKEFENLKTKLLKLQLRLMEKKRCVVIIFEGFETAEKFAAINCFTKCLNPNLSRVISLSQPTKKESGQWYFQRYVRELPNEGEIVLFNRSWYNRAIIEPINDICTGEQYGQFLRQSPEFEYMLIESGVDIIKFWFSATKDKWVNRFNNADSLSEWNLSGKTAEQIWDEYTHYKNLMFAWTSKNFSPWIIIEADDEKTAQIQSIRHVLSSFDFNGQEEEDLFLSPDPRIVKRYHRSEIASE